MSRLRTALAVFSAFAAGVTPLPASQRAAAASAQRLARQPSDIAKSVASSVVTISADGSQGSGVIIDSSGVIVTNLHVLRGKTRASVRLSNGDVYDDVMVVDVDARKDLLLIKIKAFGLRPAAIGDSDDVKVGDRVVVLGSPQGLDLTLSDGLISSIRDTGEGYKLLQTNAAASPGSSGGGMFNAFGELIGVVALKVATGENLNFSVPVNYVRGLLATQPRMTLTQLAAAYPEEKATEPTATTTSASDAASLARISQLMKSVGFKSAEERDNSWVVTFKGDHIPSLPVYISAYDEFAVVQSATVTKSKLTENQANELLKLNFSRDLVKTSVDGEGNLRALNETEVRLLDAKGLRRIIDAVASLADEIAGTINPISASSGLSPLIGPPGGGRLQTLRFRENHFQIRYVASEWRSQRTSESETYQFQHSSEGVYVRVISEPTQIPMAKLSDVALSNARDADDKAKLTRQGTRLVNGKSMVVVEIELTANNLPLTYVNHSYSDDFGTVQIVAWSHRNFVDAYRDEIEQFVSGFAVSLGR